MKQEYKVIIIGLTLFSLLLSAILIDIARAHSWFPLECCSGNDCQPITEWKTEGEWWLIKTEHNFVKVHSSFPVRESLDNKRYLCAIGTKVYCIFSLSEG